MKRRIFLCTGIALLLAASTAFASPTLREGSQGNEVRVLQQALQNAGYKIKSADGIFGKDTERAVAEFQRDNKIKITGVVNSATWHALKNAPAKTFLPRARGVLTCRRLPITGNNRLRRTANPFCPRARSPMSSRRRSHT